MWQPIATLLWPCPPQVFCFLSSVLTTSNVLGPSSPLAFGGMRIFTCSKNGQFDRIVVLGQSSTSKGGGGGGAITAERVCRLVFLDERTSHPLGWGCTGGNCSYEVRVRQLSCCSHVLLLPPCRCQHRRKGGEGGMAHAA